MPKKPRISSMAKECNGKITGLLCNENGLYFAGHIHFELNRWRLQLARSDLAGLSEER
jgi:hypothetical protein